MPFERYAAAGFTSELLPILPPDAEIHPDSPGRENLLVSRGKVPGRLRPGGWFGFGKWPAHIATFEELATWTVWGSGVGLQGRKYPGLDIDVDQGELADAIEISALFDLGLAPCRFGRGARRLLVFAGPGLRKRRLAFRLPVGHDKPATRHLGVPGRIHDRRQDDLLAEGRAEDGRLSVADDRADGPVHAVELLAEGQQYVVEGVHPKTGKPYYWRDDARPVSSDLVIVTPEQIDAWFVSLEAMLIARGCEIVERSAGASGSGDAVWQGGLEAPSLDAVARALQSIPNGG